MNAHVPIETAEFSIDVLDDPRVLWSADSEEWDTLLARSACNSVFLTAAWLSAWANTIGTEAKLVGVTARQAGRLVAAAVFEARNGVLLFAGRGVSDYVDVLIDDDVPDVRRGQLFADLLSAAQNQLNGFRHFQLDRLRASSALVRALTTGEVTGFHPTQTATIGAPQMEMTVVEDRLKKKRFKRRENRLKRAGEVECTAHTSPAAIEPLLGEFISLHKRRWADTPTPSKFNDPDHQAFLEALTRRAGDTGMLRYTTLTLDGVLVAAHYGFHYDGTFTFYKPAYDPEYSKVTPGDVILKRLLEQARDESAKLFDFTIGEEAYKLGFATSVPAVISLHVTPNRLAALVRRFRAGSRRLLLSVQARFERKPG